MIVSALSGHARSQTINSGLHGTPVRCVRDTAGRVVDELHPRDPLMISWCRNQFATQAATAERDRRAAERERASGAASPSAREPALSATSDSDNDGVPDAVDRCLAQRETRNGYQDEDGCPDEADEDYDGLTGGSDRCPSAAEDVDGYEDEDGCPDPDNDGDGVNDPRDRCPTDAGPDRPDGCPVRFDLIEAISTGVRFRVGTNRASREATAVILSELVTYLNLTQNRGGRFEVAAYAGGWRSNRSVDRRTALVARGLRETLIEAGVDPARLLAVGHGASRPLTDVRTRSSRAVNERVELHRIESIGP